MVGFFCGVVLIVSALFDEKQWHLIEILLKFRGTLRRTS